MVEQVRYALQEGVAVLYLSNPPVNVLSRDVREKILSALQRAQDDDEARAIVITAQGWSFPSGPDVEEFDAGGLEPTLSELCRQIEGSEKPVVASLHGLILGGGYELALACHGRVGRVGTLIGFPEITLGILPNAGATQRLSRIVGPKRALDMLLSGKQSRIEEGSDLGLVDDVGEGNETLVRACEMALALASNGFARTAERRERFDDAFAYQAAIREARDALGPNPTPAQRAMIDAVEAAPLLQFDQGLELEHDLFAELRDMPEAKALRHVFLATREAGQIPAGAQVGRLVKNVALIGSSDTTAYFCNAIMGTGMRVTLLDPDPEASAMVIRRVEDHNRDAVEAGQLDPERLAGMLGKITTATSHEGAAGHGLVIDTRPTPVLSGEMSLPDLSAAMDDTAILVTMARNADLATTANATATPERVVSLGVFAPLQNKRAVEIGVTNETPDNLKWMMVRFAKQMRKAPVVTKPVFGMVGLRLLDALTVAAEQLLLAGASPTRVDTVMRAYGYQRGPFEMLDLEGLEQSWVRRKRRKQRYLAPITRALIEHGRTGFAQSQGYYDYPSDPPHAQHAPAVDEIIASVRAGRSEEGPEPTDEEIVQLCELSLLNEGGRLLDEGVVGYASDVDVIMLLGQGYPRSRGGPMKSGELRGLLSDLRMLEDLGEAERHWIPAASVRAAVTNGNRFTTR